MSNISHAIFLKIGCVVGCWNWRRPRPWYWDLEPFPSSSQAQRQPTFGSNGRAFLSGCSLVASLWRGLWVSALVHSVKISTSEKRHHNCLQPQQKGQGLTGSWRLVTGKPEKVPWLSSDKSNPMFGSSWAYINGAGNFFLEIICHLCFQD